MRYHHGVALARDMRENKIHKDLDVRNPPVSLSEESPFKLGKILEPAYTHRTHRLGMVVSDEVRCLQIFTVISMVERHNRFFHVSQRAQGEDLHKLFHRRNNLSSQGIVSHQCPHEILERVIPVRRSI